jgi:hypothetical protein
VWIQPFSSRNEVPGLRARSPNVLCFGSIPRTCLLSIVNTCSLDAFCASFMDGFIGTQPRAAHCLGLELPVGSGQHVSVAPLVHPFAAFHTCLV